MNTINTMVYGPDGKLVRSEIGDVVSGKITITEGDTVTVVDIPKNVLDQLRAGEATENKKKYAAETVPQLKQAAERLLAISTQLKALPTPVDPQQVLVGQALLYTTQVLTAICAGVADLVDTLDKNIAFRQIDPSELIQPNEG